jgi:superoxide dismutase, Cu-Zn family
VALSTQLVGRVDGMCGVQRGGADARRRKRCYSPALAHGATIGTVAALALLVGLGAFAWVAAGSAQEAPRAAISVAPVTFAGPASETRLSIRVGPKKLLPRNSSIRVRGVPIYAALSHGYAVAPGIWTVPLLAAERLAVIMPREEQGRADIVISLVKADGSVLAEARTVLVTTPASAVTTASAPTATPHLDPSPLAAIRQQFDAFLARTGTNARRLTAAQEAEKFSEFLTWPQNPLEVSVTVRLTSTRGVGEAIGTINVKNGEIIVAGRKETGLFLKPNLRGLRPGLYAFHVHEKPNCGPALQEGQLVPGLGAGTHLWLSGTGALSGTTFTSHLGNLPHLEVDADETATKLVVAARLTLADIANRSLVIHATQDDFSARLACGAVN